MALEYASSKDEYLVDIYRWKGDYRSAFWDNFAGSYPPDNWDEEVKNLSMTDPDRAATVGTEGIGLDPWFPSETFPSGKEVTEFEIWAGRDGWLGFLPAEWATDEEWAKAFEDFCEAIAQRMTEQLYEEKEEEIEAFLTAIEAYENGEPRPVPQEPPRPGPYEPPPMNYLKFSGKELQKMISLEVD